MKTKLPLILMGILTFSFAFGQQRSDDEISGLIIQLEEKHKGLFSLPHSEDFIREVIVEEVNEQRKLICPNFPKRGDEHPEGNRGLFKDWIKYHRDEYDDYISHLNEVLLKYAAR